MLDFSNIKPAHNVDTKYIFSKISQEQIFAYYAYGFRSIGKKFLSPLRKEKDASAEIKYSKNGRLYFTDYAGKKGLGCFDFVQELYSITFPEAVRKVACDFGLADCERKVDYDRLKWVEEIDKGIKIDTNIQFELVDWPENYIKFWDIIHVPVEQVKLNKDCFPIGKVFLTSQNNPKGMWLPNYSNKPRFVYVMKNPENEAEVKFKIYSPGSKFKWLSNCPNNWPFGYFSLPYESDTVIITKSYKDMQVTRLFHSDTCATQNESIEALRYVIGLLKGKYKRFILWYDADEAGLRVAKEALEEGLVDKCITTPLFMAPEVKDQSEFSEYYGTKEFQKLLKTNLE